MIRISKQEREMLEANGLIRYRKQWGNRITQDSNLVVTNREHVGKNSKTYYIVEEPHLMKFLGYYDGLNLQRINQGQFDTLVEKGLLDDSKIQHWGKYNPKAVCYENQFGEYRISKVTTLMLALGLWKDNRQRRFERKANKEMNSNIPDSADFAEEERETNDFTEMFKI